MKCPQWVVGLKPMKLEHSWSTSRSFSLIVGWFRPDRKLCDNFTLAFAVARCHSQLYRGKISRFTSRHRVSSWFYVKYTVRVLHSAGNYVVALRVCVKRQALHLFRQRSSRKATIRCAILSRLVSSVNTRRIAISWRQLVRVSSSEMPPSASKRRYSATATDNQGGMEKMCAQFGAVVEPCRTRRIVRPFSVRYLNVSWQAVLACW